MKIPLYRLTISDRDQLRELDDLDAVALAGIAARAKQRKEIYAKALIKHIKFDGIDPDDALEAKRLAYLGV